MIKRLSVISILVSIAIGLSAQNVFQPKQINSNFKGLVYKEEFSLDLRIMTNGGSIGYTSGDLETYYKTSFFQFDIGYLKDSKERRQNMNTTFKTEGSSQSFVYGKQNSVLLLRGGKGFKRYLSEKAIRRGLAAGFSFEGGVTLALLKPNFLKLKYFTEENPDGEIRSEKYSEENHDTYMNFNSIFGGTNYWKGVFQSTMSVGLHGRASGHFAMGAFDKNVRAAEIGLSLDIFPKKLPIFVETETLRNRRIFLNLFVSFHLGRRSQ